MADNPFEKHLRRFSVAAARTAAVAKRFEILEKLASRDSLKELVERRLKGRKLVLASNREPYVHYWKDGKPTWLRSAGGLTVALDSMAAACGATWVCHGSGDADFEVTDSTDHVAVPPRHPSYTLRRLALSDAELRGYYEGFSNTAMWPLCHISYVKPHFNPADWQCYRDVNAKFAAAIASETPQGGIVFQDYHLSLVAGFLKQSRPDLTTVLFWHIPWPNPEIFRICPYKLELLEGLLSNDILGFHLRYHADNFMETVGLELEAHLDWEKQQVLRGALRSRIRAYPISIDFESIYRQAEGPEAVGTAARLVQEHSLAGLRLGIGVDRLDYTKGVPERLAALGLFFDRHPEWRGRFTFIQVGVPSRMGIEDYQQVVADIEAACEGLNVRLATPDWRPVILLKGKQDFDTLVPFYKLADLCLVSSLHDGMNLVAKEFVAASSNDRGVLLLSPFTGAATELEQAMIVNPYDVEGFADAIHTALLMPAEEQRARLERMREQVAENNIYRWAQSILQDVVKQADDNAISGVQQ